jgi:NAD(P)-dependent dehydrogenase (short-subunit alcohol dehydrogenase family)
MVQNDAKEGGESAQAVGQMLVAAGARNDAGKKEAAQAAGEKKGADAASPGRRIAVTGANRGLGLEFVRQYLKRGDRVFALVRKPDEASDLAALSKENPGRLTIVPGDVADDASIEAARKKVSEATDALDILVNNAGTSGARVNDLAGLDLADLRATYEVNAIGPIRVARALVPLLKKGRSPKIVSISSQMGSIENNRSGGAWGYRMSKAALNMANRNLAHALRDDGISCVVLHPGWVRTDMGGPNATLSPEESIRSMIKTIDGVTIEKSGAFFDKDGAVLPW